MPLAIQTNPTYLMLMLPGSWKWLPSACYDKKYTQIAEGCLF